MIEAFQNINKAFESKVRLGIMAVLMVNEDADFNTLKELLSLTDGNLASHTRLWRNWVISFVRRALWGGSRKHLSGLLRRKESFQNSHRSIGEFSEINIDVWLHTKPDNTKYLT